MRFALVLLLSASSAIVALEDGQPVQIIEADPAAEAQPAPVEAAPAAAEPPPAEPVQSEEPAEEPPPVDLGELERAVTTGTTDEALKALREIRSRRHHEARPILLSAMERTVPELRLGALSAWETMGLLYPEERVAVEGVVQDPVMPLPVHVRAAQLLARMGDRRSLPVIIPLLEATEPIAVEAVHTALKGATGSDLPADAAAWRAWQEDRAAAQDKRLEGIVNRLDSMDKPQVLAAIDELAGWQDVRWETHELLFPFMESEDKDIASRAEHALRVSGCPEPAQMSELARRIAGRPVAVAGDQPPSLAQRLTVAIVAILVLVGGCWATWHFGKAWILKKTRLEHGTRVIMRRVYSATGRFRRNSRTPESTVAAPASPAPASPALTKTPDKG